MRRSLLVALLALAGVAPAWAGGDHARVVGSLEAGYGVRHHGVPFLWLARLFVHEPGLRGLKVATFEGVPVRPESAGRFEQLVRGSLGPGWSPFVSVSGTDERTVVCTRPRGAGLTMIVATHDAEEMLVVQMDVTGEALQEWLDDPAGRAHRDPVHGGPPPPGVPAPVQAADDGAR